ncbi:hypothetical protein AMTR_s00045p00078390 [Amborella trichopoda]|uniref:Uncharacterized protein n=1 Tax=Amborella trichopoda TaxID=13333 RepID=W1P2V5_AMBTC|nr:hypothetical protein AMTR_s00045p00078390 [Amborella trichopoda]
MSDFVYNIFRLPCRLCFLRVSFTVKFAGSQYRERSSCPNFFRSPESFRRIRHRSSAKFTREITVEKKGRLGIFCRKIYRYIYTGVDSGSGWLTF